MEWGFGFAENLLYYYNKSNTDGKRLIIGSVFPENFTFENNKARTTKESDFFALMCYTNQELMKIKKPNKNDLSGFVPGAGIEPARTQCPQDFKSCDLGSFKKLRKSQKIFFTR